MELEDDAVRGYWLSDDVSSREDQCVLEALFGELPVVCVGPSTDVGVTKELRARDQDPRLCDDLLTRDGVKWHERVYACPTRSSHPCRCQHDSIQGPDANPSQQFLKRAEQIPRY